MGREQMKVLLINGSPHHHFLPKIKEKPNISPLKNKHRPKIGKSPKLLSFYCAMPQT